MAGAVCETDAAGTICAVPDGGRVEHRFWLQPCTRCLRRLLMPRMRFGYIYASVASNLIAITVAYFCYKIFIFKTRGNYWAEWMRCILVYGSALLPGLLLLPVVGGRAALRISFGPERSLRRRGSVDGDDCDL